MGNDAIFPEHYFAANKNPAFRRNFCMAEREGFEPSRGF